MWDLSSPTRDWTHSLYSGNIESQPLDHQGTSTLQLSYNLVFVWCVIFHPFTFSPFMSLYLKSMSCKCIVVLITFIQFDNLCFLERAFVVVSCVLLLVIPRTAAHQASLSFTLSWSLLKLNVHQVGNAIQPSHPLSPPSPALSFSQHQDFVQRANSLHQVAKVLEVQLQHQSFQWILRTDLL